MKTCEICSNKAHHTHHIVSKCYGGSNSKSNKCTLCASCHSDVHSGELIIEGRFMTSSGYVLLYHRKTEESITNITPQCFTYQKL